MENEKAKTEKLVAIPKDCISAGNVSPGLSA